MSQPAFQPYDEPWHHDREPNWRREGYLGAVCWVLRKPAQWTDPDGYEHEITAAAFHPVDARVAWVECRQKQRGGWLDIEYRLKAQVDERIVLDWVVETYNPFFGCIVGYLAWHGDHIVMIYEEKHHIYACALASDEEMRRVQLGDHWRVIDLVIEHCAWRSRQVERLALPHMNQLPPLVDEQAQATGLLWGE